MRSGNSPYGPYQGQYQMPYGMPSAKQVGVASGVGGIGAGLANMLFPGENPYEKASPYFNQIPGQAHQAYDPYVQQGQQMGQQTQGQYSQLMNDPGGRMNQIGQSFHQSPGFEFAQQQGMNGINNAAAAGGMLGTPAHMQNAAQMNQGLANQDYYNYLGNALGMYGQGLQGGQQQQNMGFNASGQLGNALMGNAQNQGAMAYGATADKNQAQQQQWGDIFGGLGSLAMAFM